jgi:hypothetical protein
LVSFDPKTSISMIGRDALAAENAIEETARLAASDVGMHNQEACVCSRVLFVEGEREPAERFCERLQYHLAKASAASGKAPPLPRETADQIDMLRLVDDHIGVWGKPDGNGLVVLSKDDPVDFHPINKTANVVLVPSLDYALRHITVATQTVGVHPPAIMAKLRDRLASGGAQRIVRLGDAGGMSIGAPHDSMYILHRFVHWIVQEDGIVAE